MCWLVPGRKAGGRNTDPMDRQAPTPTPRSGTRPGNTPPRRPFQDRMLGGVAAGRPRYTGVDVTIVRIAFVVLTLIGGAGIPLYLAGLLLIPDEGTDQSLAATLIA